MTLIHQIMINMSYDYEKAKNKLLTFALDDECQSFFEKNNCILELAYCNLLKGELEGAENLFKHLLGADPRAHWGSILCGILLNKLTPYPTYFELRNFFEIDINLLINYQRGEFVEELIRYADVFSSVNSETYKYLGRVFWANEIFSYGKFFLEQAKNYMYNDPELHILLANVYIQEGRIDRALNSVNTCLCILPEYFPAIDLKKKLMNN